MLTHALTASSCTELSGEGAVLMRRVYVHAGRDPCLPGDGAAGEFRCCGNFFCRQIAPDAAAGNVVSPLSTLLLLFWEIAPSESSAAPMRSENTDGEEAG